MSKQNKMIRQIFPPGTPIIVTKKISGPLGVGTLGFVSYAIENNHSMVVQKIVIIRRGQAGKERVEITNHICTQIFNIKKDVPDQAGKNTVEIAVRCLPTDITKMKTMDYIGWVLSFSLFLENIDGKFSHNPFLEKGTVWKQQDLDMIRLSYTVSKAFSEDPEKVKETFGQVKNRIDTIKALRSLEAKLSVARARYILAIANIEQQALQGDAPKWLLKMLPKHATTFARRWDALTTWGRNMRKIKLHKESKDSLAKVLYEGVSMLGRKDRI